MIQNLTNVSCAPEPSNTRQKYKFWGGWRAVLQKRAHRGAGQVLKPNERCFPMPHLTKLTVVR